jgi:hypothetical protein
MLRWHAIRSRSGGRSRSLATGLLAKPVNRNFKMGRMRVGGGQFLQVEEWRAEPVSRHWPSVETGPSQLQNGPGWLAVTGVFRSRRQTAY